MKKVLVSAIIIISLMSCNLQIDEDRDNQVSKRIIPKGSILYKGVRFMIVEVDGKEYMTTSRGGIVPLDKKQLSNEK